MDAWCRAVVALSATNPENVLARLPELRRLPRLLPPGSRVILGGQGAEANASRLRRAGLKVGPDAIPMPAPAHRVPARS